tara:strand:+ start:3365 stop:3478 length:114 start_codon:yes stop_codon:yes gene_type:complete
VSEKATIRGYFEHLAEIVGREKIIGNTGLEAAIRDMA